MSTIVAIADGQTTLVASDTRRRQGRIYWDDESVPKYFTAGPWLIAGAGEERGLYAARIETADLAVCASIDAVARRLRAALREDGFHREEGGGAEHYNPEWLVARAGAVWLLDGTFCPTAWQSGRLAAIGSGAPFALGADCALRDCAADLDLRSRVVTCVQAARSLDVGTGGDVLVACLAGD